ncbi:SPFH domain-containing protein [Streptomyces goshikiensis]|uniref:SPFH domain-containing protein n=1 Tax=Streptomyces goshikiensis TaxID=1942 RepID=UPI00379B424E
MYPTRTTFATGTFAVPPRVSRPGRWQEVGTLPPSPAPRPGRWVDAAAAAVPAPASEPDSAAPSPAALPAAAAARPAAPVPGPASEPERAVPETRCEAPAPWAAPRGGHPAPEGGPGHPASAAEAAPGHGAESAARDTLFEVRPPAAVPAPSEDAAVPLPAPGVRGEIPAPAAAPESGPAPLPAVGGPEARGEHPDPVEAAEPGPGSWTPAGQAPASHPGYWAEAGTMRPHPAQPAEVRGEVPAPTAAPESGTGSWAEAAAPRPARLAAVGGPEAEHWGTAEAHPDAVCGSEVRGGHPVAEADPGHGRGAETVGVPTAAEAEHDHGRWAEEAPPASLPGQLAPVGGPEPLGEAGPGPWPEPAAPAPVTDAQVETAAPDGRTETPAPVPEVRAEADAERRVEAVVPDGRADVPVPGAEAGLSEVRAEGGFSRGAEGGVPDGWVGVPAPGAEAGVSDGRAEDAVPGGRAGVPAPAAEVRAGVGVSDGSGAGAAVGVPHTRDGDEAEARPGRGDVPAARADAPGPGVADVVARAVARGIRDPEAADGRDGSRPRAGRGAGVAEVPVRLPFRAQPHRQPRPPVPPRPAAPARPRADAGRRVPRGDDRLREHRGPVLPGWVAVFVGALALTGCAAVLWRAGVVPAVVVAAFGATPRAYQGLRVTHWPPLAFLGVVALVALGGLGRARAGHAWVLTLFGRYRGTVRRTGLTWVSPLLLRRRVDVRLRHWRSDPMPAVDAGGLALRAVVQVVWQVKDTARATLAVEDHTEYLAEQVESAMARVLSRLPADAFHEDAPTLRDAEAVGDALTRMLAAETEAVGIEVYSAQPTRIEYAPEVAEAMRRRRVAAIDAKHRDAVLTSVVDAVDDTVHRLTSRGLVELDDYERKALVKDLTVAFYTGRPE